MSHLCWDNFDLNEETPSGSGTTHSTHGIMIQERSTELQTFIGGPNVSRTKRPCFIPKHPEPNIDATITSVVDRVAVDNARQSDFFWSFCRVFANQNSQVPGWAGWVSRTSSVVS